MSRRTWAWARLGAGAAVLAVLVGRLGTGPFLDGLHRVDPACVVVALAVGAATTVLAAWRWTLVARGLGVGLSLRAAVPACYRAQLLNLTLPGGVVGDVHRGVRHGRDARSLGRGLRSVGWERAAGQAVQVAVAMAALLVLPSPLRAVAPLLAVLVLAAAAAGVLGVGRLARSGGSRLARPARAVRADVRDGLLARPLWPRVVLVSLLVVAGHVTTFLVAARTAGVTVPTARLLPLALVVLVAMALPTSVGGWGPREGATAWLFAAAGLGAASGLSTATVYGVMSLVAALPGVLVLGAGWLRGARRAQLRSETVTVPVSVALPVTLHDGDAVLAGAGRG